MSDFTTVEQQIFGAVQAALDHYAPELHLSIEPVQAQVAELATTIVASAENALRTGVITTAAAGIGGTLGTAAGGAIGTSIGGPVGTGLGATAGAAIGTLIGNTLGGAFTQIAEQWLAAEAK